MNAVGWTLVASLGVLWLVALCNWGYWQGKAGEWKARAEVRADTIDRLYEDRRAARVPLDWKPTKENPE